MGDIVLKTDSEDQELDDKDNVCNDLSGHWSPGKRMTALILFH